MPIDHISKIMLCSDGLTNMVSDEAIESIISQEDTSEKLVNELVNNALENGGIDNITCILVDLNNHQEQEVSQC